MCQEGTTRLTRVSVNVLIVVSDPQVPEDGGLVEVAEGGHVVDPIAAKVLAGLDLVDDEKSWIKTQNLQLRQKMNNSCFSVFPICFRNFLMLQRFIDSCALIGVLTVQKNA